MRISPFYEYYGGHLGFLQNITSYTCKKKWNPIFFLSLSYSEPESVAKSILTSKKANRVFMTNEPTLKVKSDYNNKVVIVHRLTRLTM